MALLPHRVCAHCLTCAHACQWPCPTSNGVERRPTWSVDNAQTLSVGLTPPLYACLSDLCLVLHRPCTHVFPTSVSSCTILARMSFRPLPRLALPLACLSGLCLVLYRPWQFVFAFIFLFFVFVFDFVFDFCFYFCFVFVLFLFLFLFFFVP